MQLSVDDCHGNVGKGEIHITDRELHGFVVAHNGVAAGWGGSAIPDDAQDE